ncbi:MAG: hypothetical protein U0L88_12765 [Acutalibacteraceae bacterium]|nr:hypothetical protein [Acutalibacteraceae bacterium]
MIFDNYAILLLKGHNRFCNFSKSHFGNITCGKAKCIESFRGIEINNILKILSEEMFLRINAEPFHHHICHAICNGLSIKRSNHILIEIFQETVVDCIEQIANVVGDIIFRCISCGTHNCRSKRTFILYRSESAFKGFNDFFLILRLH